MPDSSLHEWEYTIQLSHNVRVYRKDGQAELPPREGVTWELTKSCPRENGGTYFESIVVSPGVFRDDEEAKADALRMLSILRCPLERPLDKAIRWMLEG